MSSRVQSLYKKRLITPPPWLPKVVHYETMMGSVAYGVSTDYSDEDIYGFCIPKKKTIFPHLDGHIIGFGRQPKKFEQYQQHHIVDKEADKQYDLSIYGIVKYFQLCMENNPNMIDSLFTPQFCVLHITAVGQMVREARELFLHKGAWYKFKGYAYSQLHKMKNKNPIGKRKETIEKFGFDVKFAYHTVRLLNEIEQILQDGTINIQKNKEQLKAIRRGDVSESDIMKWASDKEIALEKLYNESKLRDKPAEEEIKQLLINCLEQHFGSLDQVIVQNDKAVQALIDIDNILKKNHFLF